MTIYGYCKRKIDVGHSWQFKVLTAYHREPLGTFSTLDLEKLSCHYSLSAV